MAMSDTSDWKTGLPRECCAKCHFFIRHPQKFAPEYDPPPLVVGKSIVTKGGRRELVESGVRERYPGPVPHDNQTYYVFCYGCDNEVWDSEQLAADQAGVGALVVEEVVRSRGRGCFYYAHTPGTSLAAAKVLEQRKVDRREARDDRQVTREEGKADRDAFREEAKKNRKVMIGALVVSALMLIASVVIALWDGRESPAPERPTAAPTTTPAKIPAK